MTAYRTRRNRWMGLGLLCCLVAAASAADPLGSDLLVVELGATDGTAATAWCADSRRLVQVLTTDAAVAVAARKTWDGVGLSGRATILVVPDFSHLPYASDLIDLMVVEDWAKVDPAEISRVVVPRGRVIVRRGGEQAGAALGATRDPDGAWRMPADATAGATDHAPSLSAGGLQIVDDAVAVKRASLLSLSPKANKSEASRPSGWMQWLDGIYQNVREQKGVTVSLAGCGVYVSAGLQSQALFARSGGFFLDKEGPGSLEVRDAHNGLIRWVRPFCGNVVTITPRGLLAALPSGPIMPRIRDESVMWQGGMSGKSALSQDLVAWDLADGRELGRAAAAQGPVTQILSAGDRVIAIRGDGATGFAPTAGNPWNPSWTVASAKVIAGSADGDVLVLVGGPRAQQGNSPLGMRVLPFVSLSAYRTGDGKPLWSTTAEQLGDAKAVWFGQGRGLGLTATTSEVVALASATGLIAWRLPYAGNQKDFQVGVVGDAIALLDGKQIRLVDPASGAIREQRSAGLGPGYGHWACATGNLTAGLIRSAFAQSDPVETDGIGSMPIDFSCKIGTIAGEGLLFCPLRHCICFTGRTSGQYAVRTVDAGIRLAPGGLETGPAFGIAPGPVPPGGQFRADLARSSRGDALAGPPTLRWRTRLAAPDWSSQLAQLSWRAQHRHQVVITAPVVAGDLVLTALPYHHEVVALRRADGAEAWRFTADGLIDAPPTVAGALTVFGCHDGRVYALDTATGRLAWRRRISPVDEQIVVHGQLESRFPVPAPVAIRDGIIHAVAGLNAMQGLWYAQLDAATGDLKAHRRLAWPTRSAVVSLCDRGGAGGSGNNDCLTEDTGGRLWCAGLALDPKDPPSRFPDHLQTSDAGLLSTVRSSSPIGPANAQGIHDKKPEQRNWLGQSSNYHGPWAAQPSPIKQSQSSFINGAHVPRADLAALGARGMQLTWDDQTIYGVNCYGLPMRDDLNFDLTAMPGGALFAFSRDALAAARALPRTFQPPIHAGKSLAFAELAAPLWSRVVGDEPIWALFLAGDGLLIAGPKIEPATAVTSPLPYWDSDPTRPTIRDPVLSPGWLRWLGKDGSERGMLELPAAPCQDGIIATGGQAWLTLHDGSVICVGR